MKILYTTGKEFVDEEVNAVRENKLSEFHNKYKKIDVLIFEDIQSLKNNITVQKDLIRLLKSYLKLNKQIRVIISGDNSPRYLDLENDLRIYINDEKVIELPSIYSYKDRLKHLEEILEYENNNDLNLYKTKKVELSNEILELVARKINTNYTDLEDVLRTLFIDFKRDIQITIDYSDKVVDDYIKQIEKFNCIVREVENYFNIDKKYNLRFPIHGVGDDIIYARKIAWYLCFKYVKIIFWQKSRRFNLTSPGMSARWYYDYKQYIKDKPDIKKDIKAIVDKLKLEEE